MPDSEAATPAPCGGVSAAARQEGPAAPEGRPDALLELRDRVTALVEAANALIGDPTPARFDALSERHTDVLSLREAVLTLVTATIDALHTEFAALLEVKAEAAPWLTEETERLISAWRRAYPATMQTPRDALRDDIARASAAFDSALAEADSKQRVAREAKVALESVSVAKPSRVQMEEQARLSEESTAAFRAALAAIDEALATLEPAPAPSDDTSVPDDPVEGRDILGPPEVIVPVGEAAEPVTERELPPDVNVNLDQDRSSDSSVTDSPDAGSEMSGTDSCEPSPSDSWIEPIAEAVDDPRTPPERLDTEVRLTGDPLAEMPTPESFASIDPEQEGEVVVDDDGVPEAEAALWHAVSCDRLGIAYHIAHLRQVVEGTSTQPSRELIAALAFGNVLDGPSDELAAAFAEQVSLLGDQNLRGEGVSSRDAINLLLFAATLRPSLFASSHGEVVPLLRRVELSAALTPVFHLATTVADHAAKLHNLDVQTLVAALDADTWEDLFAEHVDKVRQWREHAAAITILFAPASAVWRSWLSPNGVLGDLSDRISSDDPKDVEHVRDVSDLLDNRRKVHALIHGTDRQLRGAPKPILGRALTRLQGNLQDPVDLAREWIHIMDARPAHTSFGRETVESLRSAVGHLAPAALEAIKSLHAATPTGPLTHALASAAKAIRSLAQLFRPNGTRGQTFGSGASSGPLSEGLLFVIGLRVTDGGDLSPSMAPSDALPLLVETDAHVQTLSEAFDARLARGDLTGAHAVTERLLAEGNSQAERNRERLAEAVAESRASVQQRIDRVAQQIEQTFGIGKIPEDKRAELADGVRDASSRMASQDRAYSASDRVADVEKAIEGPLLDGLAELEAELKPRMADLTAEERAVVQRALDSRDLGTLHEQLDWLEQGQPLLELSNTGSARLMHFVEVARRMEHDAYQASDARPAALISVIAQREDALGVQFSALSEEEGGRASKFIQRWFDMTVTGFAEPKAVESFFDELGFSVSANGVQARSATNAVLRVEPVGTRDVCPVFAFGSDAEGRYDLVLTGDTAGREPRERIIQAIAATEASARPILLHFGRLTIADRESLREWALRQSRQFIMVDETLVLYLASQPTRTLRAFFDCTLPFTCVEPYFTAPGLVPPESFFGREAERSTIMEPYGSCFVYGGRQLGKTALLHAVQAAFHRPAEDRLAMYVDLKARDVGVAYGAEHIWQLLWGMFSEHGVVDSSERMPRGQNSLIDAIAAAVERWLSGREYGRILLLLDEADAFLKADLDGDFHVATRLKGLMDQTRRRFKVVLCGLHNVLRNTERANHPLAHLGEPICVGPLLANGGLQQARALVREPLAAIGYEFEHPNLITRILLQTNYYPSLIQLYGEALLRHLRQKPPHEIPSVVTAEDIERAFQRDSFRDQIRGRFALTLQLDQRYEVIVYSMALEMLSDANVHAVGMSSSEIADVARSCWSDGFKIDDIEFRALLHEMCGLGLIRLRASNGAEKYVLRNPNVQLLLGDVDEIVEVLSREKKLPALFVASAYHAQYPSAATAREAMVRRGPLTFAQESLLKGGGRVALMCGSRAANFDDVLSFLRERMEDGLVDELRRCTNDGELAREVNLRRPRERNTYVYFVHQDDPWGLHWIVRTAEVLRTAARGRNLRVVFRADPADLWHFIADVPEEYLDLNNGLFDWVGAKPWSAPFLARWCSDVGLHETATNIDELLEVTGGWPMLLERYASSMETSWDARIASLRRYVDDASEDIRNALGIGGLDARRDIAPLLEWGPFTAEDAAAYAELRSSDESAGVEPDVFRRRRAWGRLLGLVQESEGSEYLNPLVERLLR